MYTFTLILLGDRWTGKSAFVRRQCTGEFYDNYEPTVRASMHPIGFGIPAKDEMIRFDVWDTPGTSEKSRHLYTNAHCAIIMFDVTSPASYENVSKWHRDLVRVSGDIPIVLCGNKVDANDRKVLPESITYCRDRDNMQYFDLSCKAKHNCFDETFLWLARKLLNDPNLLFGYFGRAPPEVVMDAAMIEQYERDLRDAPVVQLPDDDEEL